MARTYSDRSRGASAATSATGLGVTRDPFRYAGAGALAAYPIMC